MENAIHVIVVVYNQSCSDSLTCEDLRKIFNHNIQVLVFDNSTEDYNNQAFCEKNGWKYLGGTGNKGLSVAYNACIDYIVSSNGSGWICLFDDDTHVDNSYFEMLLKYAKNREYSVIVPLIYSQSKLISPSVINRVFHGVKLFETEQKALNYSGQNITAINSGMAIRTDVFREYRYDENIFLDGIDHKFIADMISLNRTIGVMPYRCCHEFSGNSSPPHETAWFRFKIFAKDMRYIYRNRMWIYCFLVGKRALHLSVTYKSLDFLRVFLSAMFLR